MTLEWKASYPHCIRAQFGHTEESELKCVTHILYHRLLHTSLIAAHKGFLIPDYQQQSSKEIIDVGGISEE